MSSAAGGVRFAYAEDEPPARALPRLEAAVGFGGFAQGQEGPVAGAEETGGGEAGDVAGRFGEFRDGGVGDDETGDGAVLLVEGGDGKDAR